MRDVRDRGDAQCVRACVRNAFNMCGHSDRVFDSVLVHR